MLSDATKDAIRREVARYPRNKTALLPALKLAQNERGWLPPEAVKEVAQLVCVPHSAATELATFYSMLHTSPVGKVRVEVCIQLPCALKGAEQTVTKLAAALDVDLHGAPGRHLGGATKDGAIEVHGSIECYGACHRAPMCRLAGPQGGDAYREHLDDAAVAKLVDEVKRLAR